MNRTPNTPAVPLICALALVLAAFTGAVSGSVSARITTATAPDTPTFGVQTDATFFTKVAVTDGLSGNGGINFSGPIALGDVGLAANGTQIIVDDTLQQVQLGNTDAGVALIVDAASGLLNANGLSLLAKRFVTKETTSPTLAGQNIGAVVTNIGATGAITATLLGAQPGDNYCFYVGAAQALNIDPATGDQIVSLTNAAGDKITNNTPGSSLCLVAADTTNWMPLGVVGTWTDAN